MVFFGARIMDKWLTIEAASKKLRINKANLFDLVANKELKLTWNTCVELVWLYMIYGVDDEPLQVLPDGRCRSDTRARSGCMRACEPDWATGTGGSAGVSGSGIAAGWRGPL